MIRKYFKLIKVLFLAAILIPSESYAIEKDKKLHLTLSAAISSSIYAKTNSRKKAFYGCVVVGGIKEVADKLDGRHVSGKDLTANLVGCLIGSNIKVSSDSIRLQHTWVF